MLSEFSFDMHRCDHFHINQINNIFSTPRYDFSLPRDHRNYLNLSGIQLCVQGRLWKRDNETLEYNVKLELDQDGVGEKCALVANSLYSLFSSATLCMGDNQVL